MIGETSSSAAMGSLPRPHTCSVGRLTTECGVDVVPGAVNGAVRDGSQSASDATAGWWTVWGMEMNQPLFEQVSDIERLGQVHTLLTGLSKYLDTAASATFGGTLDGKAAEAFTARSILIYRELRSEILDLIMEGPAREQAATMLRDVGDAADLLEVALIADQAHMWLESGIRHGTFEHRIRLISVQLGLEEAAANAQLSEQRERAAIFEKRSNKPKDNTGGTYM